MIWGWVNSNKFVHELVSGKNHHLGVFGNEVYTSNYR